MRGESMNHEAVIHGFPSRIFAATEWLASVRRKMSWLSPRSLGMADA